MELNDHGIYRLPDGREFLVRAGAHGGFILHDIRLGVASAPVYLIDGSGQFLSWGRPTRWSLADLSDTGRRLRRIGEHATFVQQEFNRAFVLMQYFGYMRRHPPDAPDTNFDGYNFWLNKLNQFNGNFINAEMVKAFIISGEYRQRFGP